MPPEDPASEIAAVAAETPAMAAPRRAQRLVPVAPKPQRRPAAFARVPQERPASAPKPAPAIESKLAGLQDPEEILKAIRTEAALRRAQRLSGAGDAQRQTIRVLSVCMLFALLAAAVGAMWYLQTSLQGSRRAHRPPASAQTPVAR